MASTQSGSESDQFRELGNAVYRRVTDRLAPSKQRSRLQQALKHYEDSLATAADDAERSSACKNLAMTSWKLAKIIVTMDTDDEVISSYFSDALRHFQSAKEYGKGRDCDWQSSLVSSGMECWLDVQNRMQDWEHEKRMRELKGLVAYIMDDVIMGHTYLDLARHYFRRSTLELADKKYQRSTHLLVDCRFYVKEARRLVPDDPNFARACEILEEDILAQTCVAEFGLVRVNGEELLQKIMEKVLHWLQRITTSTPMHDQRAAMSRHALRFIYDTVVKITKSAKTCLWKVLEQADSMIPRAVRKFDLLAFVRASAEKYERERLAEDKKKRREEARELLQDDLNTLKNKFLECTRLEFLMYVYTTYPPLNPRHKLGDVSDSPGTDEMKKLYKIAVTHYHPDKVKEEVHGEKWKMLTEEITKLISKHYDDLKSCR